MCPVLYSDIEKIMDIIVEMGVKIVFTSAGNPATYTTFLKSKGITVVHVVSSVKFALKAQEAGVDAVVAEGFEAGGHNGRNETTTMVLVPAVKENITIPLIAAGGIGTGSAMLAAMVLGAGRRSGGKQVRRYPRGFFSMNFLNKVWLTQERETPSSP